MDQQNDFQVGNRVTSPHLNGLVGNVVGVSLDPKANPKTSWVTIRWDGENDSLGPVSCFHYTNVRHYGEN